MATPGIRRVSDYITLSNKDKWAFGEQVGVRGAAFYDGGYRTAQDLVDTISECNSIAECGTLLQNINGQFALVYRQDNQLLAAVDHICSTPLFYTCGNSLQISDTANNLREQTDTIFDPYAAIECLYTSYVTGQDTLAQGIKQVQAGEYVVFDLDQNSLIDRKRYHSLRLGDGNSTPAFETIDSIFKDVFQRFIRVMDGRTVLLSLSGGYDSRLIALMLSRLGYENVITYTHDLPSGSPTDIPIAEAISNELGYDHITISPSHEDFRQFSNSEGWRDFWDAVDYLSNIPSPHETIVLQKLQEHESVPDDAVDVRGHLPIPHGGPSYPDSFEGEVVMSRTEFRKDFWNAHYKHWDAPEDGRIREYLFEQGLSELGLYQQAEVETVPDVAKALSDWYAKERMAKCISHDQEYDFVGFDWWFPLWDREYLDFLETVPLSELIGKRIHKKYVEKVSNDVLGEDSPPFNAELEPSTASMAWSMIKQGIQSLPDQVEETVKEIYHSRVSDPGSVYDSDPRYGLVSEGEFHQFDLQRTDIKAFYLLLLYREGFFDLPVETELDEATRTET